MHHFELVQPPVFMEMIQHICHSWIWGSTAILPYRSSPAPSGWIVNVGAQPFSGPSRDAQLGIGKGLAGSVKNSHRFVLKPLLCALGQYFVGRQTFSRRSCSLLEWFSSNISLYLAAFIFPSIATTASWEVFYRQQVQPVWLNTAGLQWRYRIISRKIRIKQPVSSVWNTAKAVVAMGFFSFTFFCEFPEISTALFFC